MCFTLMDRGEVFRLISKHLHTFGMVDHKVSTLWGLKLVLVVLLLTSKILSQLHTYLLPGYACWFMLRSSVTKFTEKTEYAVYLFQVLHEYKFEFLRIVCSHEHYIPLSLPLMRKGLIKTYKGTQLLIDIFKKIHSF